MLIDFIKKVFGTRNDRILKGYSKELELVNILESSFKNKTDQYLKSYSEELKQKVFLDKIDLNFILPNAFALVREVSFRVLGLRHYDVQILGGIALHYGKVVEIATGEGKTLIATLPVYLNSLTGGTVHVVTVNDYLAKRDYDWMGDIYKFLGLSIGVIYSELDFDLRKNAYSKDVVYGSNNEFGFDYLRDNMVYSLSDKVQGNLNYVILDEIDSILIDEARTPLIISSSSDEDCSLYLIINKLVKQLSVYSDINSIKDYVIDEKLKQVHLTDEGFVKLEKLLINSKILSTYESLYSPNNIGLLHIVYSSLKANLFFKKNVDYIVKDNKLLIVDEHTGRVMQDRRWSDGIHQALEAKENLVVQSENNILASITFQNYFRLYSKLSGMTGTAYTVKEEFYDIYGLDVIVIPPNKKNIRIDSHDFIFVNKSLKFNAITKDIVSCYKKKQPVLVGTVSIEVSEYLSDLLKKINVLHNVLNAKYHEKEAYIIAEAGKIGSVTIATNMAGRGTDIVLGGSKSLKDDFIKVVNLGGLRIIGTERHEARRIDNQLIGRSARQGDPGSSQFYLSLEDDLIRIFVSDRFASILSKFAVDDDKPIKHDLVTKAIENAQKRVENYNFDIRKQLLEFDDIINEQRKIIYERRDYLISGSEIVDLVLDIIKDIVYKFIFNNLNEKKYSFEDALKFLIGLFKIDFGLDLNFKLLAAAGSKDVLADIIFKNVIELYSEKKKNINDIVFNNLERIFLLRILDLKWKDHLLNLEQLKKSIHLRGYANKDPKNEYKEDSYHLFEKMLEDIKYEFVCFLFKFPITLIEQNIFNTKTNKTIPYNYNKNVKIESSASFVRNKQKIGRNEHCYCESRKKYKHCHGKKV